MRPLGPWLAAMAVVAVAAVLVTLTLRQPNVPTYAPTAAAPGDIGRRLVGPVLYTVDATEAEGWRYFSFRLGSVIADESKGWDLAFRRYAIITSPGGGALDLGERRFDDVRSVPAEGYVATQHAGDARNPAIAGWYTYGFFTHVLTPKPHVWALRTADGRYAKLEMVGYYCPGARPGCPTFRYVFQGDGSTSLAP